MEDLDATILFCIFVADCTRRIGTAVVNEQEFPMCIGLHQYTLDASIEIILCVVDRNDDGNQILTGNFFAHLDVLLKNDRILNGRILML